jgi:LuxR family maltose regulon positive regulatory protein
LIERLNEGLHCKLTLISAPAGFGKTTLVSEWVAGCKQPVAWLSLDEGDNDPARFLTYFVAALQTLPPKTGGAKLGEGLLAALQSLQPSSIESILTTLLNEITSIPDHFVLVLDDYHRIDSEPIDASKSVDDSLTFLLDHLPPQMHLVITTREDPSLPLARYRVRGQLNELRAADLRFTPEEAGVFLNQMMNLNLSVENIAALETRTEGWIAGLQLASLAIQSLALQGSLALRGREDIAGFIQAFTGSHRYVLDYLAEEVLQHHPEPIRSFLLQTAILDRFCAPLCNAVTEREDGKEMLGFLERSNLFLVPLDDQRKWYRYHHLFADVLQAHLMEAQPDQAATLHQRASAWYEHNGLPPDAIRHALAANDFERAAGLIELAWPTAEEGSILPAAWLSWVKALPEALVHARPVLTVGYAYALLGRGEMEAAQARLTDAERWLEPADILKVQLETPSVEMVVADQEQFKFLPAAIAVGRAYIAQALGNIPDTVRFASRVIELVPEGNHLRHGQASMLLGMAYWASGDLEAANRIFADYTLKLRTAGNIPDAISTTIVVADIRLALGRLQEAISTIEQLLKFVMEEGEPISPDTADLHRGLSELFLELGDLEAATQHLQRSKELGDKAELPVWRYRWCIAQARLNSSQADLDGALALLDEAERLYVRTPLPDMHPISAMKARIWVAQGRLTKALEWVHEQDLSVDDDLGYLREFEHITLARILIAQYLHDRMDGSIHAARRLLERLLQAAEEGSRMGSVIEILVLQAFAHQADARLASAATKERGDIMPALVPLERALTLAEPEGYVRIFVDEGPPMTALLREATKHGIAPKYVSQLLTAFGKSEGKKSLPQPLIEPASLVEAALLVEALSERELEVLRLLRSELSGPEIAQQLIVSLNTLRTHTQNIYAKLGVNNRRAAVRRAEELNLL